jgi:hypothetical protein
MRTLTKEYVARLAKDFYAKHKRVPLSTELGNGVRKRIYEYWPSWGAFLKEVIGKDPAQRSWTDEQLLKWLRELYQRQDRFPTHSDIEAESSSVGKLLYVRFGDLHTAFERAIGTSVRAEILIALKTLTPPGCNTASTNEIYGDLLVNHIMVSKQIVANTLDYLKRSGAVIGGRRSQTNWWSLTLVGSELLKAIEKERGDGKQRA